MEKQTNTDFLEDIFLYPFEVKRVMQSLSQTQGWHIKQLNIPETWSVTRGSGINVMVIDTGFTDHPDLEGAMDEGLSESFLKDEKNKEDLNGHGCVSPNTLVHTNFCGIEEISKLYNRISIDENYSAEYKGLIKNVEKLGLKTYSLNSKTGQTEIDNISLLHKTKINNEVINVELDGNINYQLTPWHPVYVYEGKSHKKFNIIKKRADELTETDRMIFNRGKESGQLVQDYFRKDGLLYRHCEHCGFKYQLKQERKNRWQCKKCNKGKYFDEFSTHLINESLAYLIGLIISDGHLQMKQNQYRVEITSITDEILINAQSKLDAIGFTGSYIREEKNRSIKRLIIDNKEFHTLLVNLGVQVGTKTYTQSLPEFVGKSPYNVICAFIAGVIDGDGCISKTNSKNRITSASLTFVKRLCALFNSISISCSYVKNSETTSGFKPKVGNSADVFNLVFGVLPVEIVNYLNHPKRRERAEKQIEDNSHTRQARKIKRISKESYDGYFYDFTVEKNHTYIANGHFVSNTHVCGIIGARDNSTGMVGVAPDCKIFTAKVLGKNGSGSFDSIREALLYAKKIKPDVINMSLGSHYYDPEMHKIIKDLYKMNIPVIAASGNDSRGNAVNYPAKYPEVICVTAFDKNGKPARFNSTGPEAEFSAPGVDIHSTWIKNGYVEISGTSMATPFVAGIVALLIAKHKKQEKETGKNDCKTVSEIREHLIKYSDDKGIVGRDNTWGYGVIDAVKVINTLESSEPITVTSSTTTKKPKKLNWFKRLLKKLFG